MVSRLPAGTVKSPVTLYVGPAARVSVRVERVPEISVPPVVVTATVVFSVVLPRSLVAVSVYVVVEVGLTRTELPRTSPTSLSMATLCAPETSQDSSADSPEAMVVGFEAKRRTFGAFGSFWSSGPPGGSGSDELQAVATATVTERASARRGERIMPTF